MRFLAFASLLIFTFGPAQAQTCPSSRIVWSDARLLDAAADEQGATETRIAIGEAIMLALRTDPEVTYITLPKGAGEEASFGGLASIEVTEAGRYRVGLEEAAWVDVVRRSKQEETVSFGRAPECSGLHKQVSFDLDPGTYVLEVSGNLDHSVGVIVERVDPD